MCGCADADGVGVTSALLLATGDAGDAAIELTVGTTALDGGAEIGDRDVGLAGVAEEFEDDNADDGNARSEAIDAASWWVQALAAANTEAAVSAAPTPRRPRPWLATSRG